METRCDVERVSCGVFHGFEGLTGFGSDPGLKLCSLPGRALLDLKRLMPEWPKGAGGCGGVELFGVLRLRACGASLRMTILAGPAVIGLAARV